MLATASPARQLRIWTGPRALQLSPAWIPVAPAIGSRSRRRTIEPVICRGGPDMLAIITSGDFHAHIGPSSRQRDGRVGLPGDARLVCGAGGGCQSARL